MIAQKSASAPAQPEPVIAARAEKSPAAIRAQRFRERQKQNSQFNADEAKRKRDERKQQREQRILQDWEKQGFPTDLDALSRQGDRSGLYAKEAPRGKGKLVSGGHNSKQVELISGIRAADATTETKSLQGLGYRVLQVPLRAQLTDEELQTKLQSTGDLQAKINLILEQWKHDKEFCKWLNDVSVDEATEFIKQASENLEYARQLLYEHTEHQAMAEPLTHAQPHGTRVQPEHHGSDESAEEPLSKETERTFTRKISFKRTDVQVIQIGNRNARFYNLQNGTAEQHLEEFVQQNTDRDQPGHTICGLCKQDIAPEIEAGFKHFGSEHRQEVIDHIRFWEAKAWRPKSRKCSENHAKLTERHRDGSGRLYCGGCGKWLNKPAKPVKRSDAPSALATDLPIAA
jgi:hypothetical protein